MSHHDIKSLPEWAQDRLRWLEQREDNMRAEIAGLKARLAAAEARAKRAVGLLGEARCYVRHVAGDDSLDEYGACVTTLERIDALLKEVPHGQQG